MALNLEKSEKQGGPRWESEYHSGLSTGGTDIDDNQVEVEMNGLREILDTSDVVAQATGGNGYVVNVTGVSGTTVTLDVYEGGGSSSVLADVGSGTSLSVHVAARGA